MNETLFDSAGNVHESLRRKFSAWTLAVVSSLSTSAAVGLNRPAWADDQSQSTTETAKEKSSAAEAKPPEAAKPKAEDATEFRAYIHNLLQAGKMEQATAELDEAVAKYPDDGNLMYLEYLAAGFLSRTNAELAQQRFSAFIERALAMESLPTMGKMALYSSATYSSTQVSKGGNLDEALSLLDRVLHKGRQSGISDSQIQSLVTAKARLRLDAKQPELARKELEAELNVVRTDAAAGKLAAIAAFCSLASAFQSVIGSEYPDVSAAYLEQAESMVRKRLDADDVGYADFSALISLKSSRALRLSYTQPKLASQVLDEVTRAWESVTNKLKARLELESTPNDVKKSLGKDLEMLAASARSLDSLRQKIDSALEREALVGTSAPEFEADAFVGTDATTLRELKGKVVLIDFWAVWCGPCIATFPHLIHLNQMYGEKGLVIIGITRHEKYVWDENAQKAVKKEDVSREDELLMLEKFREHYKLHHGFVVLPEGSRYMSEFKVRGIPQAAILDQEGVIQLIQVGSGEESAKTIETKIQQLLGS